MSEGMPSMTALLGMVALAGYQNRDKITEMLTGAGTSGPNAGAGQSGLGGLLGSLGGLLGGAGSTGGAGNLLNNGLNELLDSFKQNGQGDTAQSWIEPGPNKEISPPQLKQAIGSDVLALLKKRQDFRNKSCLPDFRASFRQQLTSTRQTAVCRGPRLRATARTANGQ